MNLGNESEFQEHKESLSQLDKGIKSRTARLNKHFQAIVNFGVDDNGNIKGLQLGKRSLDDVRERIALLVQPKPYYELLQHKTKDGKDYLVLKAQGTDIPYSCDGRFYIRNVKSDDLRDNTRIRNSIAHGSMDTLKETDSPDQDLKFEYLYGYFIANGIHVRKDKSFLDGYGLINSNGHYNYIALLLSDKNNVSIKVVRFNGTNKSARSSRTEFGFQSLLASCQAVLDHRKSLNTTRVNLSQGKRIEQNLFDYESFREAWINALVHNDWLHRIPPAVFIYDDRIEVSSYGTIPFGRKKEDFFKGKSKPINPSLFHVFSLSSFSEQSGHGIPNIVHHYTEKAFDFSSNRVLVTLPFSFVPDAIAIKNDEETKSIPRKESNRKVLIYLTGNPDSSLKECAEEVGLSLSGVKKIIKELQNQGKIRRIGPKNGGKWSR